MTTVLYSLFLVQVSYSVDINLQGYLCNEDLAHSIEMEPMECKSSPTLIEHTSREKITLLHREEVRVIKGHICHVSSTVKYHFCSHQQKAMKHKSDHKVLRLSGEECMTLINNQSFIFNFREYNSSISVPFHSIKHGGKYSKSFHGQLFHSGRCHPWIPLADSNIPLNMIISVELTFKFEPIILNWLSQEMHLSYLQRSLQYDPSGYSIIDQGTVTFDPRDLDCKLSYSKKVFPRTNKVRIGKQEYYLVEDSSRSVIQLSEHKAEYDRCLKRKLTQIEGKNLFICRDCPLNLQNFTPSLDARLASVDLKLYTLSNLFNEISTLQINQLRNEICKMKDFMQNSFENYIPYSLFNQSEGYLMRKRGGMYYYARCQAVNTTLIQDLETCYIDLPVKLYHKIFFLDSETKILRNQSEPILCSDAADLRHKVRLQDGSFSYLCNSPSFEFCHPNSQYLRQPNKFSPISSIQLATIFNTNDYYTRIKDILFNMEEMPFQNPELDFYLPNSNIQHKENNPINREDVVKYFQPKQYFSFILDSIQTHLNIPYLNFENRNYFLLILSIFVERLYSMMIDNNITFLQFILLLTFCYCPVLYILYLCLIKSRKKQENISFPAIVLDKRLKRNNPANEQCTESRRQEDLDLVGQAKEAANARA